MAGGRCPNTRSLPIFIDDLRSSGIGCRMAGILLIPPAKESSRRRGAAARKGRLMRQIAWGVLAAALMTSTAAMAQEPTRMPSLRQQVQSATLAMAEQAAAPS